MYTESASPEFSLLIQPTSTCLVQLLHSLRGLGDSVFVQLPSLRLRPVAINTSLDFLIPVSAEPHNSILTEPDDEQRHDLAYRL